MLTARLQLADGLARLGAAGGGATSLEVSAGVRLGADGLALLLRAAGGTLRPNMLAASVIFRRPRKGQAIRTCVVATRVVKSPVRYDRSL